MNRTNITDGSARWFDLDAATKFDEKTYFNGNNHVSIATGDQFHHEALYRTAKGLWVLNHWSQWQGSRETYVIVDEDEAHEWLLKNGHDDAVPQEVIVENEV